MIFICYTTLHTHKQLWTDEPILYTESSIALMHALMKQCKCCNDTSFTEKYFAIFPCSNHSVKTCNTQSWQSSRGVGDCSMSGGRAIKVTRTYLYGKNNIPKETGEGLQPR